MNLPSIKRCAVWYYFTLNTIKYNSTDTQHWNRLQSTEVYVSRYSQAGSLMHFAFAIVVRRLNFDNNNIKLKII